MKIDGTNVTIGERVYLDPRPETFGQPISNELAEELSALSTKGVYAVACTGGKDKPFILVREIG